MSSAHELEEKQDEIDRMKINYVNLQKQYDEEVVKRELAEGDAAMLQRQVVDSHESKIRATRTTKGDVPDPEQVSSKIFHTIDYWMRYKDLEQAVLRNSALSDLAFSTLSQMLLECPSLCSLDLSQNHLTMDSCSNICHLVTR